jgi:LysM repeat protein
MLKYWIQLGLFIGFIFIISSSTFIKGEEADKLYVIQLFSSPEKIWTDAEVKVKLSRFKSLESYGFIYETSYLNHDKIDGSKLLLGTYENHQTATYICEEIKRKGFNDAYVQPINKRQTLGINHSIKKTSPQKGNLSTTIQYNDLEIKGGTGTVLIKSISKDLYSFTVETYDESLELPNNSSGLSPPRLEPENTLSNSTSTFDNGTTNNTSETIKIKRAISKNKFHTVGPGDTLFSLAKKYDITQKEIRELNNLPPNVDHIKVGDRLQIKK